MMRAFAAFVRSAGGDVIEREGVVAGINPQVPERSVFNSVVYDGAEQLAAVRDEIAAVYADRGCAWTVWVPEEDRRTATLLEGAGHTLDAAPRAMGMDLGDFGPLDFPGVEWSRVDDLREAALLNDHAYGYPEGTWMRGMGASPGGQITYVARLDDRPASTVAARYEDG